ncbi:MAG: glycosyltransferase family 39 protein [Elusimicrobiota bacterium]
MFKKINKKFYYHLISISVISIFLRIILLLYVGPRIENDTPLYLAQIYNIYDGKCFSITDYVDNKLKPTAYRMPLFQTISAYSAKILNIKKEKIPLLVAILNILFSTGIALIGVLIALIITKNQEIAILTGYLSSINPNLIYNSVLVLTDTTFSFIIAVFIFVSVISLENNSKRYLCLSGIILGLSVLTRPITKFYFLFHIFLLFFILKDSYKNKIKKIIIFSLSCLIIVSPWIFRNYYRLNFLGLETNQGLNTLWSTARLIKIKAEEDKKDKIIYEMKKIIIETMKTESWPMKAEIEARKKLNLSEVEACKYLQKIGVDTIISSPFDFIKIFLRNIANNITSATAELKIIDFLIGNNYYEKQHKIMTNFENIENRNVEKKIKPEDFIIIAPNLIFRIIHLLIFCVSLIALCFLFKENKNSAIFLFSFISYLILLTSAVASYDRYRLPYEVILNFLFSYMIIKLLKKENAKNG